VQTVIVFYLLLGQEIKAREENLESSMIHGNAGVAQLVEHHIRNVGVAGSSPAPGSR
jgi:hypothetical protein